MYFFNLKIKSLTSQKGLNSWDLLRASSSPHWPWREGPEMTLNGSFLLVSSSVPESMVTHELETQS